MNEEKKEALRREFSALLDNELDPETRATVEAELAEDAEALRELELLKRVDALYRDLPRHTAPEDFEARVHAALENNVVLFSPYRNIIRWAAPVLAAAMVLIVAAGLYFTDPSLVGQRFQVSKAPTETSAIDAESKIVTEKVATEKRPVTTQETDAAKPESLLKAKEDLGAADLDRRLRMEEDIADTKEMPEGKLEGVEAVKEMESVALPMEIASSAPEPATPDERPSPVVASPKPMSITAPSASAVPPAADVTFNDKNMPQKKQSNELTLESQSESLMSEEVAGSALMKDRDDAPARQLFSIENRIRMLRDYRAKKAEMPEQQGEEAPRTVAGRVFNLEQAVWVEASYQDEEPEYMELGSDAYAALAKAHPELREMETLGTFILVSFDGVWYFVYTLNAESENHE